MIGNLEEEIMADLDTVLQEDSAGIQTAMKEALEDMTLKRGCTAQPAINAAQDAKFLSSQAGTNRFTAATALEKAKVLISNQEAMINIKKSLA